MNKYNIPNGIIDFDEEERFFDKTAICIDVNNIDVNTYFKGATFPENRWIVQCLKKNYKTLKGVKLLDLGSGIGVASVFFAQMGAHCVAVDLSHNMINNAIDLAKCINRSKRAT